MITNGMYGDEPLSRHLSPPLFGIIYAAYRQNMGTPRDLTNPRYQELKRELLNTLKSNPGVTCAAAHDYNLQITPFQGNYHIVVAALPKVSTWGQEPVALQQKRGRLHHPRILRRWHHEDARFHF